MSSLSCQGTFWVIKPKTKIMLDCVSRVDKILTVCLVIESEILQNVLTFNGQEQERISI